MKQNRGGKSRKSQPMKFSSWNLSPLFSKDNDPAIEAAMKIVEEASSRFIRKWKDRDDYLIDPATLKKALDDYESWQRSYGSDGDAGYYFWLRTQQDQNNASLKAGFNKIEEASRKIENDIRFFHLRLAKIPLRYQKKMLQDRALLDYHHYLEKIFIESRHLLSEAEERILNLKSATSHANWTKMTSGFLAGEEATVILEKGRRTLKNFSEISSLMNSADRKTRNSAARAFNKILSRHADVAEAEINSVFANKKIDDELRSFARPDHARHVSDDIDTAVVDSLIETVAGRFDIPARYYALKAKLMRKKKLQYHERNLEYGSVNRKYSFSESCRIIMKVLRDLDSEFALIFQAYLDRGQIDAYPRKGKAGGAFCSHHLMSQPTYILLNHTGRLSDVLTFAHEVGHGINNELIKKKQNALNFGTPISTAEVASTFLEDYVLEEILRHSDDELRLSIVMMKLNDDVSTIFRQVACYRFEQELHEAFRRKAYLSKEEIGELFMKHMHAYMGDFVEQSPGSANWWIYWSHIRYFFYVYSYASGLLISKSLQRSLKENPEMMGKLKEFLSKGLSDSPSNIFLGLGIDIADNLFWKNGLDEVERLLLETEDLAKKLGKM